MFSDKLYLFRQNKQRRIIFKFVNANKSIAGKIVKIFLITLVCILVLSQILIRKGVALIF